MIARKEMCRPVAPNTWRLPPHHLLRQMAELSHEVNREHKFSYAAGICRAGRCMPTFQVVSTTRHVRADEVTREHKFPYAAGIQPLVGIPFGQIDNMISHAF